MLWISDFKNWIQDFSAATFSAAVSFFFFFPYLRFQRFQIDMLESFLSKKNEKKILFLLKDIGGKRSWNFLCFDFKKSLIYHKFC